MPTDLAAKVVECQVLVQGGKFQEVVEMSNILEKSLGQNLPLEIRLNKAFSLAELGKPKEALEIFKNYPTTKTAENILKLSLDLDDIAGQILGWQILLELNPIDIDILLKLGILYQKVGKYRLALNCFSTMLDNSTIPNIRAVAYSNISGCYKDLGDTTKATEFARLSVKTQPASVLHSNLLMSHMYGVSDLESYLYETKVFNKLYIQPAHKCQITIPDTKPEQLRIGFIGGDFMRHSLTPLTLEIFKSFSKNTDSLIYYYMTKKEEDEVSVQYASAGKWNNINGISTEDSISIIQNDKIDVLVDLAGHSAHNGLSIMAHKPAPVQIGWISGMMTPPRLDTIPYFITDNDIVPKKNCLPEVLLKTKSAFCFYHDTKIEVNKLLPCKKNNTLTFGSFNNVCKLSNDVLFTWARIVVQVKDSKIIIKIKDPATEGWIKNIFKSVGVSEDRVICNYGLPTNDDVCKFYTDNIDIALDTWPCSGCLTTLEALWMGCPVVTLVGETFLHRQSYTILKQLGLNELIAFTRDEFVDKAVKLATNRSMIHSFRLSFRTLITNSIYQDADNVAKDILKQIHTAYDMWYESRQKVISELTTTK